MANLDSQASALEHPDDSDSVHSWDHSSEGLEWLHTEVGEQRANPVGLANVPSDPPSENQSSIPEVITIFSRLPLELRTKVWEMALPPARVIEIQFLNLVFHYHSPRFPSNLLHVSQEAREVALRRFKPLYRMASRLPLVYIDPKADILFINEHIQRLDEVLVEIDAEILRSLRHIALDSGMMFCFPHVVPRVLGGLPQLRSLRQITVTMPETDPKDPGHAVLFEVLKQPINEWPSSVAVPDAQVLTQETLDTWREHFTDTSAIRRGFTNFTRAVEARSRASPSWTLPQIDFMGVRRE